tara:strand:- start:559 stop:801 length:243 start_codon:yes stop_codon:yes gene_type:complete
MLEVGKTYQLVIKEKFSWISEIDGLFTTKPRFEEGAMVSPGKYELTIIGVDYPQVEGIIQVDHQERKVSMALKRREAHGF